MIIKIFNDFSRQFGVLNFLAGNTGTQMAGWFKKEIKTLLGIFKTIPIKNLHYELESA